MTKNWIWMTCGALGAIAPHTVSAQVTPTGTASADPADIIVTAQKRDERLLDTPQSVTALSSADLAKLGAAQFRDFANTVPALSFTTQGAGQTQISLRGVTTGNDVGPTVGIYVDDVPYGSSSAFANAASLALDVGLFDVARVEVLRGPQGTLYGASTMGGLVKYVTKTPDLDQFGGEAQVGVSGTRGGAMGYNAAAAVNLPIVSDKIAIRASGFYTRDGGYIDNLALGRRDVNRADIYGGRIDVLLAPTDALRLRLTGYAQNIDRDGNAMADFTLGGVPIDGSLDQRRLYNEPFDQQFRLLSATIDYDFGPAKLTSISSYQTVRTDFRSDLSAFYVPLFASIGLPFSAVAIDQGRTTDKFTQEVRLASSGAHRLEWVIGGFYTNEKSANTQQILSRDLSGQASAINLATLSVASRYEEYAAFGDLTLHLTDRFDLSGGLRYAANRQRFQQDGSGLLGTSIPLRRASDDVFTYLANARYKLGDRMTAYLRYATGYRPGGPNFLLLDPMTGLPTGPATFKADHLQSYEAGIKAETADRTFGIDLSVYHIDWNDIQVTAARSGGTIIANAGRARVDGGELTLTARPSRRFTASGAFAYQNARLADADADLGAAKGERLPNVPRFTATLNTDYRLPETRFKPSLGATLRFVSDRRAGFNASPSFPQYRLPSYATVDLRAGASFGPVDAQLFVHNLLDERGQLSAITLLSVLGGPAQVSILQPRTIGISATTHF